MKIHFATDVFSSLLKNIKNIDNIVAIPTNLEKPMYNEYEHLTEQEKICYKKLLKEAKEYKTEFKFYETTTKTISNAFQAMLTDHPEIFWLSGEGEIEGTYVNRIVEDATLHASLSPEMELSTIPVMAQIFESAVSTVVARAKLCKTTFLQVLAVHDYIIDSTTYDLEAPARFNAYGCLVQNRAVCAGYSKAFMLIMNRLGYRCGYAAGFGRKSGERHAWNYIEIDGEFYHIDVTQDDPTVDDPDYKGDNKTRDYFCVTTNELLKTHVISDEFPVPFCGGTKYNYYNYNNRTLACYEFDAVSEIATPLMKKSGKFSVKFTTIAEADRAFNHLINQRKIYTIPGAARRVLYFKSRNGLILTIENN